MNKSSVLNYLSQHYLLFLLIAGCQTLGTSSAAPGGLAVARNASQKCLQIYYDAVPSDPKMTRFGRLHALHLDNLVGHFPKIQTYVIPLARYQAGDIERCASSIYLGTYYDAPIPETFLLDFVKTSKHVAWLGYNFWKLGDQHVKDIWGIKFKGLSTLDLTHRDDKGRPGFYKYYTYKQETFKKFGEFDRAEPTRFNAAWEIPIFSIVDAQSAKNVLSWAKHSTHADDSTPWAIAAHNKWLFGDSPFSFVTQTDRYLIFCDVLFDILDELPRRGTGKRPALFRLEDVHPKVPLWQLYRMVDVLKKHNIPFSMTTVPIYSDPLGNVEEDLEERFVPITRDRSMRDFLDYARDNRATFIFHGVTHQLGSQRNPFTGMTGDDFEFWNRVKNRPIDQDNVPFILNRLEDGLKIFDLVGIRPLAWIAPHYQASPLSYVMFGQLFTWSVGRVIYFPYEKVQSTRLPETLTMDQSGPAGHVERKNYLADLKVTYDTNQLPSGQFYPYEIYGDAFRQRIIPENAGNVQEFMNEQVLQTHTVDELIADMRLTRVIRDAWGSFFIHPFCLDSSGNEGLGAFPGDVREVERLIQASKDLGYEFLDLKSWMAEHTEPLRPETIEVF